MRLLKSLMIILAVLAHGTISAQENAKKVVLQELYQLQNKYSNAQGLSLDLRYTYSGESKPEVILDSLSGSIQYFENGYKMIIEHTETIKNERYVIVLFGEDSLMYISANKVSNPDRFNLTAMIDSSILNSEEARYAIFKKENFKHLVINYPEAPSYKSVRFVIDDNTGFLVKTILILKTELLTAANGSLVDLQGYDAYAVVETSFFNHKQVDLKDKVIDEQNFFKRSGKEFSPTEKYKNYRIFIGTPNL